MVLEVASEAGIALAGVDLFAATTGPGGFTGVRVGLAALRGFALAAARPMLGITSFAALAHATTKEERAGRSLLAVIDSKRDELFVQAFDENLASESEGMIMAAEAIEERHGTRSLLLAGDGAVRVIAALRARGCDVREAASATFIDAAVVARMAAARASEASAEPPAPFYLRPPSVTTPAAAVP